MAEAAQAHARRLGGMERMVDAVDRVRPLNFVVVAQLRGELREVSLRAALDHMQRVHPILGVSIRSAGLDLCFYREDVAAIQLRVDDSSVDDLEKVIESEMQTPLPREHGPLVRCRLLRHGGECSTLLLCFNHVIGDGNAGAFLLEDLLNAVREIDDGRAPSQAPTPFPASVEAHMPASTQGLRGFGRLLGFALRTGRRLLRLRGLPMRLRFDREAPVTTVSARLLRRTVEGDVLQALVARCRAEQSSVHGAMSAAVLVALRELEYPGRSRVIGLASPVDMRARMDPPVGKEIGCFISLVTTNHRVTPKSVFWDLARDARNELVTAITREEPFAFAPAFASVIQSLRRFLAGERGPSRVAAIVGKTIVATTGITNIGVVKLEPDRGRFRLESVEFTVAPSALTNLVMTAATYRGCLHWNFIYNEPRFERARIERFADACVAALEASLDEPTIG